VSHLRKARAKYREFHGIDPDRIIKVDAPDLPPYLVILGKLLEIDYEPTDPTQKKGQYWHEFGDYGDRKGKFVPLLATDPEGRQLYIVKMRSGFKINKRGIVG